MDVFRTALGLLSQHWRLFIAIHLCVNLFVAAVLAPLLSLALRFIMLGLGEAALTDQDILFAFLSPLGFALISLAAALFISVSVTESSAFLLVVQRVRSGAPVAFWRLGRYLLARYTELILLAFQLTLRVIVLAAPFLALAGWLFLRYLTEYDINYYLSAHPPEFVRIGALIVLILLAMAVLLVRALAGWALALPLVLLGRVSPGKALRESKQLVSPERGRVLRFIALWAVISLGLFAVAAGFLKLGGMLVVALAGDSLAALAWLSGGLFLSWSLLNFFAALLASLAFVVAVLKLYERLGPETTPQLASIDRQSGDAGLARWALLALGVILLSAGWSLRVQLNGAAAAQAPDVFAHRGASFDAPENTLAAIEEAIAQGAQWAEIDVQETAEGHIVVIHDKDLMKVGGSPLTVFETPLDELRTVDIGSYRDARYAQERVPLLSELLTLAKGRIKLNIELKYYGKEQRLEERVARLVEDHEMQDDVVLMSLHLPGVRAMKALRPGWEVGLLSSVALGDVTRLDVDFFAVNAGFANRKFVQRAHDRGRQVLAWTVNDAAGVSAMASAGVDGIITDRPAMALSVLRQRAELDTHERLLIKLASLLGSDFEETP